MEINDFYCPILFELIEKKLHIIPLWTGIMIKHGIKVLDFKNSLTKDSYIRNITRLENNCVENRFGYIKHSIMLGVGKGVAPSEILPSLYLLIKVKINLKLIYLVHY